MKKRPNELELLRELRSLVLGHLDVDEWWGRGHAREVRLQTLSMTAWERMQETIDASHRAYQDGLAVPTRRCSECAHWGRNTEAQGECLLDGPVQGWVAADWCCADWEDAWPNRPA